MNPWWKGLEENIPLLSLVVQQVDAHRAWLLHIVELVSVSVITASILLYASDQRQDVQIQNILDKQADLVAALKDLRIEVMEMRHDLYTPKAYIGSKKNFIEIPRMTDDIFLDQLIQRSLAQFNRRHLKWTSTQHSTGSLVMRADMSMIQKTQEEKQIGASASDHIQTLTLKRSQEKMQKQSI